MKLPCYLVRDLLPLFKDNVCDPNTAADVQEHLDDCAACRTVLQEMDAPEMELAALEEKNAASIVALTTVKKDIGKQKKNTALSVAVLFIVVLGVFFGWRYWMMHSYVNIPRDNIQVISSHGTSSTVVYIRDKETGVYYEMMGSKKVLCNGCEITLIGVAQTRWNILMQRIKLFLGMDEPIRVRTTGEKNVYLIGRESYLALDDDTTKINAVPWDETTVLIRLTDFDVLFIPMSDPNQKYHYVPVTPAPNSRNRTMSSKHPSNHHAENH